MEQYYASFLWMTRRIGYIFGAQLYIMETFSRHPCFINYGNVFPPPLFYQYIVGFVRSIVILEITNKCLSTFIYSSETNIVFKSCDIYMYALK